MEIESRIEVGKVSLWSAIGGVVAGAALAFLFILVEALTEAEMSFSLPVLLFAGLEVVALVAGIAGRRSPHGKDNRCHGESDQNLEIRMAETGIIH